MTGTVLLFAPDGSEPDDALVRTRWIADQTHDQLTAHGVATICVFGPDATRSELEAALHDGVAGLAFFSHGRLARIGPREGGKSTTHDDAIMGTDGPALDRSNLALMTSRWGHAIACHAGTELAGQACALGAVCFVAYEGTLKVEWHPDDVPDEAKQLLADLVTRTTCNLAAGMRDVRQLKAAVNEIAEAIAAWCEDNPDRSEGLFLEVTAQQLARLVCRSS